MRLRTGISLFIFLASLSSLCAAQSKQEHDKDSDLRDAVSGLAKDIKTVVLQQQQMLDQLTELNRLLPASAPKRQEPQPPPLPASLNLRGGEFKGDSNAAIAIVEYYDFECPFCGGYERETYPQVFDNYIKTGKVKLFYRDLPLPMHPHATQAARAARCAGEQGEYWEMHDSLFARQNALSDPALLDRVKTLGLDTQKFGECFSSDKYKDDIQKSIAEAQKLGIQGTPTFFIGTIDPNGDVVNIKKRIVGAKPYAEFQAALDEALAGRGSDAATVH